MPYPVAREHPDSTPCVKKLRGSSVGIRDAAKNSVPRRRPLVEIECHSALAIWPHLSIPSERQLRPAACRERSIFTIGACASAGSPPRTTLASYLAAELDTAEHHRP